MGTCKGKNVDGTDCKNRVKDGQDFCWRHPDQAPDVEGQGGEEHLKGATKSKVNDDEQALIRAFFNKHKEGIAWFLAGASADPIVDDIYSFIREQLGMTHLIPPVRDTEKDRPSIITLANEPVAQTVDSRFVHFSVKLSKR
jgi:hypothetical protein